MERYYNMKSTSKIMLVIFFMVLVSVLSGYMWNYAGNILYFLGGGILISTLVLYLYYCANEIIGSYKNSLKSVSEYIEKIAKGEEVELMDEKVYRGEMEVLISNSNKIKTSLNVLINETNKLNFAAAEGKLNVRGDISKLDGNYAEVIRGMNTMLEIIERPIDETTNTLKKYSKNDFSISIMGEYNGIFKELGEMVTELHERLLGIQNGLIQVSKGDISGLDGYKKIGKRSENDELMPAIIGMMESVKGLTDEVEIVTKAAQSGNLSNRADASKFEGGYRNVLEGFNKTLDVIVEPLGEALDVLERMAVNDYTVEMTGKYDGMLKELSEQINLVKNRLLSLQDVAIRVSKGDISRLDEFEKIGKRSDNDKLVPSFKNMMQVIQNLIGETEILVSAAIQGDLSVRGNADMFDGRYKEIINGMNNILNTISAPINDASNVLFEMSEGNLTSFMDGVYNGDYEKLKVALNSTIKSFNDVLNEINYSSLQVATGSKQVSDSAQSLSNGATEQASSIEELTASLEQISFQTKENAINAGRANKMALDAKGDAITGNEQMKEMLKAMNDINSASSNISKIIKVIDEIAFQTNILALNAAVEAARAGEYGKGFAVVAEEVRNLAARSANAAKETTNLIEGSIKKAEDGTKITNETAAALSKIVEVVSDAAAIVGEIANASNEQALGIAQINQGIIQVSNVVQINSATSQESAAASYELSNQADLFRQLVDKFKLNVKDSNNITIASDLASQRNHDLPKTKIAVSSNRFDKY